MKKNILITLALSLIVIGCVSGTPEEHFEKGVQAFQAGDTLNSIKEFEKVIRLKKDYAAAYFNLGICYSTPENREKAVKYFEEAVRYKPGYTDAVISLGQAYARMEKFDQAIATLKKGIDADPTQIPYYTNLAFAFLYVPANDSAIVYYKKAYQLDSSDADISYNLAYAMTKPEYRDESIRYLRRSTLCNDQKMEAYYLLGSRLAGKGDMSRSERVEAIAALEKYLESSEGGMIQIDFAKRKIEELKGK